MKRPKPAYMAWRETRLNHLATYPTCAICEDPDDPCVHHLRYRGKRGESEKSGDLLTLCRFHHDDLHRGLKSNDMGGWPRATMDYVAQKRAEIELLLDC